MFLAFDENDDGKIQYEEYLKLVAENPRLLFPAFELQRLMQKRTMGEQWFKKWMELRAKERKRKERDEVKAREKATKEAAAAAKQKVRGGGLCLWARHWTAKWGVVIFFLVLVRAFGYR